MAVVDYWIEVTLISILILKAFESTYKSNRSSSQSCLQAFKGYISIHKERTEHPIEENQQRVSSFFSKQTCLKNEWRISLHY